MRPVDLILMMMMLLMMLRVIVGRAMIRTVTASSIDWQ